MNTVVATLGGLCFGGTIVMTAGDEVVIELPCGIFVRVNKSVIKS